MINWWNGLQLAQQIFALIALPSTLILIIQTIMTLVGLGHGDGADLDGDGIPDIDTDGDGIPDAAEGTGDDGLALFSVRGILSMLTITGWVGLILLGTSLPDWAAILIAVACGVATLVLIAVAMREIMKLQSNGNIDIENCIGKVGEVYIPIPAGGSGTGKVNLTVQEKFSEFSAITGENAPIKTGAYVRVTAVSESGVLVVEPINKAQ